MKLIAKRNGADKPEDERILLFIQGGEYDGLQFGEVHHGGMEWSDYEKHAQLIVHRFNRYQDAVDLMSRASEYLDPDPEFEEGELFEEIEEFGEGGAKDVVIEDPK